MEEEEERGREEVGEVKAYEETEVNKEEDGEGHTKVEEQKQERPGHVNQDHSSAAVASPPD